MPLNSQLPITILPRSPVTDSVGITPLNSDQLIISAGNSQEFLINIGGPHGLYDETQVVTPAGGGGTGVLGFISSLGTFLYLFAATPASGVTIGIYFAVYSGTFTPTWWLVNNFALTAGVPFVLNAFSLTTAFARILVSNTGGGLAVIDFHAQMRTP